MNQAEKAIAYIPCPYCGAKPGSPCHAKSGWPYTSGWYVHQSRVAPFEEEYYKGWRAAVASRKKKKVAKSA